MDRRVLKPPSMKRLPSPSSSSSPPRFAARLRCSFAATLAGGTLAALVVACSAAPEEATGESTPEALTQVSSFGSNPGSLNMYTYVPANLQKSAPLVVALHGCTQSASAYVGAGWNTLADKEGFIVVYGEQQSANNFEECFNWFQDGDTTRAEGEAASIAQMVAYAKTQYTIDASKVYVTGLSAGAAMTAVMLATYPDVFSAGAIMAGLPYGCAHSVSDSSSCEEGSVSESAATWGSYALKGDPNYKGPFPRVSIWAGSSDTTVNPANATDLMDQWTTVNGIDQTADKTTTVGKATHDEYQDANGHTLVERWIISGMQHGVAVDPSNGCGTAGAFILDEGICSTQYAWDFFTGATAATDAGAPDAAPTDGSVDSGDGATDGGHVDGGRDAGRDAGHDAGHDAGPLPDAGEPDASEPDAAPPPEPDAGFACQSFTDTNYDFVTKGMAYRCGTADVYVCATGSGTQFGLWTLLTSTLSETAPGFYTPGACE